MAFAFWEQKQKFFLDLHDHSSAYHKIKLIEWYLSLPCTSIDCLFFRLRISFNHVTVIHLPKKLKQDDMESLQKYLKSENYLDKIVSYSLSDKIVQPEDILNRVQYPMLSSNLQTRENFVARKILNYIEGTYETDETQSKSNYEFQVYCDILNNGVR